MLIGELARAAGVSTDTVRFYIRLGLLTPQVGPKGGRNPYKIFSERDLEQLRMLRVAQSFGMSLKELAVLKREADATGLSAERQREITRKRLAELEVKAEQINALIRQLRDALDDGS